MEAGRRKSIFLPPYFVSKIIVLTIEGSGRKQWWDLGG
jgi:hypothetical protein